MTIRYCIHLTPFNNCTKCPWKGWPRPALVSQCFPVLLSYPSLSLSSPHPATPISPLHPNLSSRVTCSGECQDNKDSPYSQTTPSADSPVYLCEKLIFRVRWASPFPAERIVANRQDCAIPDRLLPVFHLNRGCKAATMLSKYESLDKSP
jgi:hypothetical protein